MGTRWMAGTATVAAGLILMTGCSSSDDSAADESATTAEATETPDGGSGLPEQVGTLSLTFDGSTCAYSGPSEVAPGVVAVEIANNSDTGGGALLLRLLEGKTVADFEAVAQPEPAVGPFPDVVKESGQVGRIEPGDSGSSSFPVETGTYVVLCLVDTDDPNIAAGYLARPAGLTVTG